jgi:hypothetical protein
MKKNGKTGLDNMNYHHGAATAILVHHPVQKNAMCTQKVVIHLPTVDDCQRRMIFSDDGQRAPWTA